MNKVDWNEIAAIIMCVFAVIFIIIDIFVGTTMLGVLMPWVCLLFAFLFIIIGMLGRIIEAIKGPREEKEE